jgi:4,5-DOPA dioxygenase extradiol
MYPARSCRAVLLELRAALKPDGVLFSSNPTLVNYETLGRDAMLSVPTPDHYLPLLYAIALRRESERLSFPVEGFDRGSISMLTVKIG